MFNRLLTSLYTYIVLAGLGFLGMYFIPMRWGARVMGADGLSYVTAARELISGRGLYIIDSMGDFVPLIHWPPGFSLVLAAFSAVIDPDEAVKILNSLLFAVNSFTVGYILRTYGPRIKWLPILGMIVFIGSTTVLKIHADAMSEPLFICCLLMTFLFMLKYQETNGKVILAVAAAFAGWGLLTRYIGVTLIMTVITIIFIHQRKQLKTLISDSSIFAAISSLPMVLWLLRNFLLTGKPTNRVLGWHPPDYGHWLALKATFTNWFVPSSYPSTLKTIAGLLALAFITAILIFWKSRSPTKTVAQLQAVRTNAFLGVNLLFALFYSLFLLYSIFFIEMIQYPNERLMFPVYLTGLLTLMIAIGDVWLKDQQNWKKFLLLSTLCIFITIGIVRSGVWVYVAQRDGWGGYNAPEKRFSETLAFLRNDPNINFSKIISNDCGAIYFWLSKSTIEMPVMYYTFYRGLPRDTKVGDKRLDFDSDWGNIKKKIDPGWLLVYFFSPMASGEFVFPSENELKGIIKLTLLHRFKDGTVYRID
jgi:hypothetical protein